MLGEIATIIFTVSLPFSILFNVLYFKEKREGTLSKPLYRKPRRTKAPPPYNMYSHLPNKEILESDFRVGRKLAKPIKTVLSSKGKFECLKALADLYDIEIVQGKNKGKVKLFISDNDKVLLKCFINDPIGYKTLYDDDYTYASFLIMHYVLFDKVNISISEDTRDRFSDNTKYRVIAAMMGLYSRGHCWGISHSLFNYYVDVDCYINPERKKKKWWS